MFQDKSSLVCCNITGMIKPMDFEYDVMAWRLFIDSSSKSPKAVLQHNGNSFSSIPIEHSVQMKETHSSMDHLQSAINYQEHKWLIYGDLKDGWTVPRAPKWVLKVSLFSVSGTAGLMTSIMTVEGGH